MTSDTQDGFYKTIELLNQTLAEDQGFGPAYADLADMYANAALWLLPPAQAMHEAKKNALRAVQLDDSLPKAHIALGIVFLDHELVSLRKRTIRPSETGQPEQGSREIPAVPESTARS